VLLMYTIGNRRNEHLYSLYTDGAVYIKSFEIASYIGTVTHMCMYSSSLSCYYGFASPPILDLSIVFFP
jgi:hypothetical protein